MTRIERPRERVRVLIVDDSALMRKLLRDVLERTGKVGIAQVVLRTRAHLAALRPSGRGLVVELLRYPHEVLASSEVELPPAGEKASASERKMAEMLVGAMTKKFDPSEYKDEYEEKLRAVLRERAKGKVKPHPKAKAAKASNVVDFCGTSSPAATTSRSMKLLR